MENTSKIKESIVTEYSNNYLIIYTIRKYLQRIRKGLYFPIQKFLKILPRISSVEISPVISPR